MSFTNGRISGITRLQIKDAAGFSFPEFDDQLQAMAFRKESATQCVVSNVGFVNINDPLDSELTTEKTLLAEYRIFALRIDRRVVPPSARKIRIMEEAKKILQETGQQCLYREQREDLWARVELELLSKVPPVTEIYDIAIDTLTGIVYVASVTAKVVDTFLDAFKEAFGINLFPYEVVSQEDMIKAGTDTIGRDFLTWLWLKSQQNDGLIYCGGSDCTVTFMDRVSFGRGGGELKETVSCIGKYPSEIAETKEALRQGKKITDAGIKIEDEGGTSWALVFSGDSLQLKSVKLPSSPDVEREETPEGRNLDRIALMTILTDTIDGLLNEYLRLRLSSDWPAELSSLMQILDEDVHDE